MRQADVVIVGAGHNGLCAAIVLAHAGLDVTVIERRARVGGCCSTEELVSGYRFSTCAYALHLLHEQVVAETGIALDVIELPARAALLPDGEVLRDDDAEPWSDAARVVDKFLVGTPPSPEELRVEVGDFADASIVDVVQEAWTTPKERAAFAPRYFDGSPHAPGSALAYAYVQTGACRPAELQGLPRGGMGSVGEAFATAARAAGVRLVLGREVSEMQGGGVQLDAGERVSAGVVLSNLDPIRTARLAGIQPPAYELRPAAAKLHLALDSAPDLSRLIGTDDPATLGLIHVYPQWDWYERAHEDPGAAFVELQLPTYIDPSLAPPAKHSLTAYLPFAGGDVRNLLWHGIERAIPNARDIAVDEVLHVSHDFEERIGLTGGNIHHLPHTAGQMFDARPLTVGDIRLCGAGAYPGGEVSGVPGLNAAHRLLGELDDGGLRL